MFPQPRHQFVMLKEGYHSEKSGKHCGASGIALIKGPHTTVVGTGLPCDKDLLLKGLADQELTPDGVEYVVCPYGHIETSGNLNLFPNATHIVGCCVMKGDEHLVHHFAQVMEEMDMDIPFEIDEDIEVVATPGFQTDAVSVIVKHTQIGTVAIAGSVFHHEDDLETPELWVERSQDVDIQQQSRIHLLKTAHFVAPRYGPLYRVPDNFKGSESTFVITP